jgi:hypothetical protein
MSGVEVTALVEVASDCEIRSVVDPRTGDVEVTFVGDSTFHLGFSRGSFKQFMEHWPHLRSRYEHAIGVPRT